VRGDAELQRAYRRLTARKSRTVVKVMVARRLAIRLYWMLRNQGTYASWHVMQVSQGHSVGSSSTPCVCLGRLPDER
jgi:hypothetical protein